jgi:monoamine oxidase
LKEIEIVFGSLPQIVDYQEYLWDADKWTSGGWQTIADVVSHHPRLHIAGTDFATEWNGYMEGALKSADHAVKQAMRR